MRVALSLSQIAAPTITAPKAASAVADFVAVIDFPKACMTGKKELEVSAQHEISFESVNLPISAGYMSKYSMIWTSVLSQGASGSGKSTIVGLLERLNNSFVVLLESAMNADHTEEGTSSEMKSEVNVVESPVTVSGSVLNGWTESIWNGGDLKLALSNRNLSFSATDSEECGFWLDWFEVRARGRTNEKEPCRTGM
jgi:hypothetical protein